MSTADLKLGSIVEIRIKVGDVLTTQKGVLRFWGATDFAPGKWAGVELSMSIGKNNGTVKGIKYFTCPTNHGVFVKASQVTEVPRELDPQPSTSQASVGQAISVPRPLSRTTAIPQPPSQTVAITQEAEAKHPPALGRTRTASIRSPPSSSPSRSASPAKPFTSSLVSPSISAPRGVPPSTLPLKRLPTLATPPLSGAQPPRKLFSQPSPASVTPPPPPSPPSVTHESPVRQRKFDPVSPITRTVPLSPLKPPDHEPTDHELTDRKPIDHRPLHDGQETHELRAKIRVLEAKRTDDARHIRELESRLAEAESFVALRPKLQAKLSSQQTDLIATRRELADAQQLSQVTESKLLEAQEQLEMTMLDKEVAEEKAEMAETELLELKEKLAVAEVEIGVLKEGGAKADDVALDAKASLTLIQLEKQNERLKEALVRLRDLSQETEHDHRRRIAEMEKEVGLVDALNSQYEEAVIKLSNAEVQVEDLKAQLDDALGAEEMLVQLTERNLMLSEKIEEMRITIEDLEALKELNDELEENHVETERHMQEDLDRKESQIRDHIRKEDILEDQCLALESTIGQFRDLVSQLQSECDALRAETQSAQSESASAASRTAAMISLNLRLQSSASKYQAKTIELELKKLEARESKELLAIVQPYLPQLYVDSDSDATNFYLFFMRLAYKADLINAVVAQIHNLPESLNGSVPEVLVGICEMRGRISCLSTLCKRFAAILRRCDVETFLNIGRIYPEMAPMEKRIDMHIDLLRRDEFREMECVSDIVKLQAQLDHLAETYFKGFDHDLGEQELGYALSFDHDLDVFGACVGLIQTAITTILNDEEAALDMGGRDPDVELLGPIQQLLDQFKSAKVLSRKLVKRLEDLVQNSTALKAYLLPRLKSLSNLVPELVNFGISLAQQIMPYLADVRNSKTPFELVSVVSFVKLTVTSSIAKDIDPATPPWDAVGQSLMQLIQETSKVLPFTMESENVIMVTGVSPWITRIAEVKSALAVNVEAERKLAQLDDEMQGLIRSLKAKDRTIQESDVKIELMERRMEAIKKQADRIAELESEISKGRKQERAYEEAIEQLQSDLDAMEQENVKFKTSVTNIERQASDTPQHEVDNVAVESNLEASYLLEQIESLRGTLRFLRRENSYLKGNDLLREIQSLPPLLEPISRPPTPPLDPSTLSDSDESDHSADSAWTPTTMRSLSAEAKMLYRDVIKFSSSPKVVDISSLNKERADAKGGRIWMPRTRAPIHHVLQRKTEAERLRHRVRGLLDRASAIQ